MDEVPVTSSTRPPVQRLGAAAPARCLSCFYVLEDLETARCPECGRDFDPRNPNTYTTKPPLVRSTLWLPGFLAALFVAAISIIVVLGMGNWGWALWIGVPASACTLLAYRVRVWIPTLVLLGLAVLVTNIMILITFNVAGAYCGLVLSAILFAPMLAGLAIGSVLRMVLKTTPFSQRAYLPALIALLIPILWAAVEGRPVAGPPERITTSRIVNAPVDAAWDSIMFYEEVEHQPPLILRIGLAHPLATVGSSRAVGDIKTCLYNKGHITKQVTAVKEEQLLAFRVIDQQIGYEHDVRLIGGSFAFEPIDEDHTRIVLTTEYEPLLRPRFAWRWAERLAVHTLHEHVLEGMALRAAHHASEPPSTTMISSKALR